MDFWISVWISADSVRDFFRNGPLTITSCLRRKDTRLSQRYIFAFLESLGTRLQNTGVLKKFVLYSPDPPPFLQEVLLIEGLGMRQCLSMERVILYSILNPNPRLFHSKYLIQPFAKTEAYYHSFFIDSVRLWNSLPNSFVNSPSVLSVKTMYLSIN